MVRSWTSYLLFGVLLFVGQALHAQQVRTSVTTNASQVYLGEPVEVTVGVFTKTWFTDGVDIGNIKVNDAFTIYFRSLSTSKMIDGETYSGVELYYNVYPYTQNDLEFPSLTFDVQTPDEGGYKGVKRQVKTRAVSVKVHPIPQGFETSDWLVTSQLQVKDSWQGDLKNVKVGDVLKRKIYRRAARTVAELIPPVAWDTIESVSYYPLRAAANNHKTKTDFYADRTDEMRYLFEKEGEVIIPELVLMWWHPRQKKIYKRTLKEIKVQVAPNPDLGMLESIKDSLAMMQADIDSEIPEDAPFGFLGMNWKELTVVGVGGFVGLKYLLKLILFLIGVFKKRRAAYLGSEMYYFHQFLKALNHSEADKEKAFYRWVDCLKLEEYTQTFFESTFVSEGGASQGISSSKQYWKVARENYLKAQIESVEVRKGWVNP